MGWKSTKELTRDKAIKLIEERLYDANNEQLGNALESLGYGDETGLKYFGCNFSVSEFVETDDNGDDIDDDDELDCWIKWE